MTLRSLALRLLPPLTGWLAVAATALPGGSPLRVAPVAVFLLTGPGAAVLRVLRPALHRRRAVGPVEEWDTHHERDSDRLELLVLAVLLSVGALVVLATVLMATHTFSGPRVLLPLTALATLAACCPRWGGSPARRGPPP
ncbi:hypothetical protein ACPXCE_23530 [Streptomyces sp. DT24]|uniref:hypothetical protein n=1 Tax=unclassified Streptomyces TaxID=2593676 RepID=UPI0023B9772F|nr:hypothetical protein [Streptomyces sp. AM 4-1-1]WEH33797.1 hypothetical protein PZB75_10675 [Streptomyces sp. AM 4-1-1]